MKILFLLTQDLESPYGLGRCFPLAASLVRLGHEVNIAALSSHYDDLKQKQFERDGVYVRYVGQMHVRKQGNLKSYYPVHQLLGITVKATVALARAALMIPADIIHVGKPHPMNGLGGLLGHLLRGKILFVDCDDYEAGSGHFKGAWQKWGVAFFEKHIPRYAQTVTTNTTFLHEKLIEWGIAPKNIYYLPNGVDRKRFTMPDPSEVEALRSTLGLQGRQVIAFIGSLSLANHPVDLLLQAFTRLYARLPQSTLLLAGGGEDYDTLKALVNQLGLDEAVFFCGRIPPDLVPLYYRLADVSVDPVRDDDAARGRSPLKLFESWACETPFVSADVGDRRMLLGDPPAGLLARPGDPDSLANCILNVLENRELAQQMASVGLIRIRIFDWDQLATGIESVYLAALGKQI